MTRFQRVFFSKTYHGGHEGHEIEYNASDRDYILLKRTPLNPSIENYPPSLEKQSLEFGEILLYILLEALSLGPRAISMMDAYSLKSFHILTEEIPNAIFARHYLQPPSTIFNLPQREFDFLRLSYSNRSWA
jgi:hypothetical protein